MPISLQFARNLFPSPRPEAHKLCTRWHDSINSNYKFSVPLRLCQLTFFRCSVSNTAKLQRIQNTVSHIVLGHTTSVHLSAVALPLALAASIKLLYQLQNSYLNLLRSHLQSSPYLSSHLVTNPVHILCSLDKHSLSQPAISTITWHQSFSSPSPSIWNKITLQTHNGSSLKGCLIHYFARALP